MKTNYHSHIALCKHAEGTIEEHILKAIELNYEIFGISDHAPLITIDNIPKEATYLHRMKTTELTPYIEELNRCKEKYKKDIKILIGLETEYFKTHDTYFKRLGQKVDYLVLGNHDYSLHGKPYSSFQVEDDEQAIRYGENAVDGMKTGYYSFMSHPDLFLYRFAWGKVAEKIAHTISEASVKYNVPLEFNANGVRRGTIETKQGTRFIYPRKEFWDIVKTYNCKVIVNSDSHYFTEHDDEAYHLTHKLAKEWGLNVIEVL